MLRSLASGSSVAASGARESATKRLRAEAYCPVLAEGLERVTSEESIYWTVRRFGGRIMSAGTEVEVVEKGRGVIQVRDIETATLCYLTSTLLN
jgi:hypothetical protein